MREATKGVLSMKNQYYIPKYRYYELKYRCLQYNEWLEKYNDICGKLSTNVFTNDKVDGGETRDITYELMIESGKYKMHMDTIKHALLVVHPTLQTPIFDAVTNGLGWTVIQAKYELSCPRDEYYEAYHHFFYRLSDILEMTSAN